jgi:16S rRNA (uracil1498-N3)-methyltransferase
MVGRGRKTMTDRVLVPPGVEVAQGAKVILDESESHHLQVRRAKEGESVELRDGFGLVGTGRLVKQGKEWAVEIGTATCRPPPPELNLVVGAGDRERFGWLVEKASELGVTAVVPLETERTAGVASRLRDAHLEKLRRRALEAIKQCGGAWAPRIDRSTGMAELLARTASGELWLADAAGQPPPEVLKAESVTVIIGPEGGFSPAERQRLIDRGYRPTSFGQHTLRFETAALAAAAAVAAARLRGTHG